MTNEDDKLDSAIQAFFESETMDAAINYSTRGRVYQRLSQDELISAWMRAFEWVADHPINPIARRQVDDLASEIRLRGSEPPYEIVKDTVRRQLVAAALLHLKRVMNDPQAMDSLVEEIEDFLSCREQGH